MTVPAGTRIRRYEVLAEIGAGGTPRVVVCNAGPFDIDLVGERFLVLTQQERDRVHLMTSWFDDTTQRLSRP